MKQSKKLLSLLLVLCMIFSLACTAFAAAGDPMDGKIVILHSNDVHGALEGYAKMAALRADYESKGAEVLVVDCGDYIQGTPYVSVSKGATAVEMMNAAGYDYATLGNHEFDFGYDNLKSIMAGASFTVLCGDVFKDGAGIFDATAIVEKGGVKIGLFGMETPETYTKVNPGLIQGISFVQGDALYENAQGHINTLKADGADVIVCLSHLGVDPESEPNRSVDVYNNTTGIDIMLDGHSHTVMTEGDNGEPIQSTGTKFANIGVVVIDGTTKQIESHTLVAAADIADDATVLAKAQDIMAAVDQQYGAVFAKSEVDLCGTANPGNRTMETNMGNLITDALRWSVLNAGSIDVPDENVVAITNGGGIRAAINKGDVTMKDVNTVLPFGNTVAVVYVTGAELLEALEASTFCTPTAIGGFPQIAGMDVTINTDNDYDKGEQYPASTYYGPNSITRVTIESVNGLPFDETATYAVVTNNFCAAGGDTYYAFKAASSQFDTAIPMDEALMSYITDELGGVIGEKYAEPQGRMFIGNTEEIARRNLENLLLDEDSYTKETYAALQDALAAFDAAATPDEQKAAFEKLQDAALALEFVPNSFTDVPDDVWYTPAVNFAETAGLMNGVGNNMFAPNTSMTRAMVATVLYRVAGEPDVTGLTTPFTDVKAGTWYTDAVIWAYNAGVTNGKTNTTFVPDDPITREQMAAMLVRYFDVDVTLTDAEKAATRTELAKLYSDSAKISDYALFSVLVCNEAGLMKGDAGGTFRPSDEMTRAECAQVLMNIYDIAIEGALGITAASAQAAAFALSLAA